LLHLPVYDEFIQEKKTVAIKQFEFAGAFVKIPKLPLFTPGEN